MNPILLGRHVRQGLEALVHESLKATSPQYGDVVERFLKTPKSFIQGPWVSVAMPFQAIADPGQSFVEPFPEIPLGFAPYQHQADAFARLGGDNPKSTIVATGTGSGKTESYLWPLLDHCRRHKGEPGIKAILIYPMNALATDQARRVAKAIASNTSLTGVRAGIYADKEPKHAEMTMSAGSIITSRSAMQDNPPDILLTNYKMLDYLLIRGQDKGLWAQNQPETLKFLVVDEMHTFDGAQGADLALLIRRLKHRLGVAESSLACVGSSATLGSGPNAIPDLIQYAETIFGESFDASSVTSEQRKTPEQVFEVPDFYELPEPESIIQAIDDAESRSQSDAARRLAQELFPERDDAVLRFIDRDDPASVEWRLALGEVLLSQLSCRRVVDALVSGDGPMTLVDIAGALKSARGLRGWSDEARYSLAEAVVSLIAWARTGDTNRQAPLFNVKVQHWIRELARMVATVPRQNEDGQWLPISLHHANDLDTIQIEQTLPLVSCGRCGSTAHLGRSNPDRGSHWAPLDQLYEEFFDNSAGNRLRLFYFDPLNTPQVKGSEQTVRAGQLHPETLEFTPAMDDEGWVTVWMYEPQSGDDKRGFDKTCPACGHDNSLLLFGLRAARLTAGISNVLYTSEHNEEAATEKPRFLLFSDSVQDAAQRAAVTEARNSRLVIQKSLFTAVEETTDRKMTLSEVIHTLPTSLTTQTDASRFVATFTPKDQSWRKTYERLSKHGIAVDVSQTKDNKESEDQKFVRHMQLRLGWDYLADLTYRSHTVDALESMRHGSCDVELDALADTAEKFIGQLANELPGLGTLDPDQVTRFIFGVLQRMRRQGSVDHQYLRRSIEKSNYRGLNSNAAQGMLRIIRLGLLPPFGGRASRGYLNPRPLALHSNTGFDNVLRKQRTNWYRDWLYRLFHDDALAVTGREKDIFTLLMERLTTDGWLEKVEIESDENKHAFLLKPEKLWVSTDTTTLVCDTCNRRELSLTFNVPALTDSPCTRLTCPGHLQPQAIEAPEASHRALVSDRNHRVVGREHTGLLKTDDRLAIEKGFIQNKAPWAPNLISATPTLEMGIDIGDLSTLLLCSVPPEEANYVQRMGRSGRRDGNALNMVMVNARDHDLQFWEDPRPMIDGQVRSPGVYISAEAVLLRQLTAFTLDRFVADFACTFDYGKVKDAQRVRDAVDVMQFPLSWVDYTLTHGDTLADAFIGLLPKEVQSLNRVTSHLRDYLGSNQEGTLIWAVAKAFDEAADERRRLAGKRKELNAARNELKERTAEYEPEAFKREWDLIELHKREITRLISKGIDNVSVLEFLTNKGLLPNYAFPEEGVKLTSLLSRREKQANDEDSFISTEYMRAASAALSEFALGQTFYAEGREVKVNRLDISQEDISYWQFCPDCSHVEERKKSEPLGASCPACSSEMWSDPSTVREVVNLRSVLATGSEEKSIIKDRDRRQQQQFDRVTLPAYTPANIESAWFTAPDVNGAPFGFEMVQDCEFRDINFGEKSSFPSGESIAGTQRKSKPFKICRHCGTHQSDFLEEDQPGEHPPSCEALKGGKASEQAWLTQTFLMRRFKTEAIRLIIPVVGELEHDDAKSFVAGINLGMREFFAGRVDHIKSTVVDAQIQGLATVRSLYLYDTVPGGSGYLRQLSDHPDSMRQVIELAATRLANCVCSNTDKTGCFKCVKSYSSQFGPGEASRLRALGLMEQILQQWSTLQAADSGVDDSLVTLLTDSVLERQFLEQLVERFGDGCLSPTVLSNGRRGFVLTIQREEKTPRRWNIETLVDIGSRYRGMPTKEVDFVFSLVGDDSVKPIVVEMDGLEFHANSVDQDLLDRLQMIRTGKVQVWSLSPRDLVAVARPPADNPLRPEALDGFVSKAIAHLGSNSTLDASTLATIAKLQNGGSLELLCTELTEPLSMERAKTALLRVICQNPSPRSDAFTTLTESSEAFVSLAKKQSHASDANLELFAGVSAPKAADPFDDHQDIRLVVRPMLEKVDPKSIPEPFIATFRGLWRTINILQSIEGLHVEKSGLDTLEPPILGEVNSQQLDAAWQDVRALSDDAFYPLINAMVAANLPAPTSVGDDWMVDGRCVGVVEFMWEKQGVAVCEDALPNDLSSPPSGDRDVIEFNPDFDPVEPVIARLTELLKDDR